MALTPYTRAYGNLPLTQITPFTYRDGLTFLQILNEFEKWLRELPTELEVIITEKFGEIDGLITGLREEINTFRGEIDGIKDEWITKFDQFMLNIIDELEGLNDQSVANLVNDELSLLRQALNNKFVQKNELLVNVKDFGAKGDGVTDDLAAVKAAIAFAPEGSTLFFPDEHYWTPSHLHLDTGEGWVKIEKSLNMLGATNTKIENFAFWVQGEATPLQSFADSSLAGDDVVFLNNANVKHNDIVQIFTAYNAYTADAGDFQMGSRSPSAGTLWNVRAGQVMRVAHGNGNTVELASRIVYDYKNSIAGLADPMPGVGSSEWRQILPVKDFTVTNIEFIVNSGSAKIWNIRLTENFKMDDCKITVSPKSGGSTLVVTDSIGFEMVSTIVTHGFTVNTNEGSGDNLILIGAGNSGVRIRNNEFHRGAQIVDVITNDIPQNPGSQNALTKSQLRTCDDIIVEGNAFYDNVMAFTCHPAVNNFTFQNNVVRGSGLGLQTRGLNAVVQNNDIETTLQGVGSSSFAHGLIVRGNKIRQFIDNGQAKPGWTGVRLTGLGSETQTNNRLKATVVDNFIECRQHVGTSSNGIYMAHSSGFAESAPDVIKYGLSDVLISNNELVNTGVRIGAYFAGIRIIGNRIRIVPGDVSIVPNCIRIDYNSAACTIVGNILTNSTAFQIQTLGLANAQLRPFGVQHRISDNTVIGIINTEIFQPFSESTEIGRVTYVETAGSLPGPHLAGELKVIPVTFENKFVLIPRVMVSANNHDNYSATAINISLTGFEVQLKFKSNHDYAAGAFYTVTGYQG